MRLESKIAIVAGGAMGIGAQVAVTMASEGAKIVVADLNYEMANNTCDEIKKLGGVSFPFRMDVSNWSEVESMVEFTCKKFGAPDILFNSIAIYDRAKLAETDNKVWQKIMDVNVSGSFYLCKAIIPLMQNKGGGSIILTSSSVGVHGTKANIFPYATSKFAVTGMTKAAACDYLRDGIRVNCICPGPTDTPMIRGGRSPEALKEFVESLPIGRLGTTEEIAQSVVFLASDESKFITGVALFVDGGQNAHV
jgi:NAD(P)-dependent dehydrogenase (short-subunit alcohol dehydrogenase family)